MRRDCGFERAVGRHTTIEVEVARYEVAEESEHHRRDGRVAGFEVSQMESHLKEPLGTLSRGSDAVLVEAVDFVGCDALFDVPVRGDDHSRSFALPFRLDGRDGERLRFVGETQDGVFLGGEAVDLVLEHLVLLLRVLVLLLETSLTDVEFDSFVGWYNLR